MTTGKHTPSSAQISLPIPTTICPMGTTGYSAAERDAQAAAKRRSSAQMSEVPAALAPCEDCGGPWEHTGFAPPGPQTVHVCEKPSSVIAEAMLADAVRVERPALPTDSNERKRTPLCTGCLDYAPDALRELAARVADRGEPGVYDLMGALADRDMASVCELALWILQAELTTGEESNCARPVRKYAVGLEVLFDAAPEALAAVAQVSWHGNEKHNPGQPLHHAREKSTDHPDCIARHYVERGGFDGPFRHSAAMLWRALVARQIELESAGAPKARGAK